MFQKMHHHLSRAIAIAASALSLLLVPAAVLADDVAGCGAFTDLSYEEAKTKAEDQGLVFMVYATASWCGPCQWMQRTTWQDEELIALIHQFAVVYKLDVDEERALAQQHGVQAMPTMIAYREGDEFERTRGARDADYMMTWIRNVHEGERTVTQRAQRPVPLDVDPDDIDPQDIQQRMNFARQLLRARKFEEATEEFLWLWQNMLEHSPSMYGVRLSFFISDLKRLFAAHEPARHPFAELRDELETRMSQGKAERDEIVDWTHLNGALGDEERSLEWYEAHKDNHDLSTVIRQVESTVYDLLVFRNRWAEAGRLVRNPKQQIQRYLHRLDMLQEMPERMDGDQAAEIQAIIRQQTVKSASRLYTSLLAAERDEAAETVGRALLERMDDPGTLQTLLETTLNAGFVREHQLTWLEDAAIAEIDDEEVRRALAIHAETIRNKLPQTM